MSPPGSLLKASGTFALSPGPLFTTSRSARFLLGSWTLISENPSHAFLDSLPIFILEPLASTRPSLCPPPFLYAPHLQTDSALFELVHFSSFTFSPSPYPFIQG